VDQRRHAPARAAGRAARPAPRRLQCRDPQPGSLAAWQPGSLAAAGADARNRTVTLPGRPFPVPADPATWDAVQACLRHRDQLATLNPHLIVTKATRTGAAPADGSYLTRLLAPAGVTPSACRQTRIAQFVNDLDPKLTAAALGMQDSGLARYLADNVDKDRLRRLSAR
jgi:hypothetical protein